MSALHQTIKLLVQAGNFRQAADREKEVRHGAEQTRLGAHLRSGRFMFRTASTSPRDGIHSSVRETGTNKKMPMRECGMSLATSSMTSFL